VSLLSILPGALKAIGKVLGLDVFGKAADALGSLSLSPEQQAALQQALQAHEEEMQRLSIEELKTVLSENLAEIASPDKFVSRARPFGLYTACVITAGMAVAEIFGVKIDTGAIVTLIAPMWGSAAWYSYNRTQEKIAAQGSGK
jgi:uncharacterized membrane protein